jgi:hypothetical protein
MHLLGFVSIGALLMDLVLEFARRVCDAISIDLERKLAFSASSIDLWSTAVCDVTYGESLQHFFTRTVTG